MTHKKRTPEECDKMIELVKREASPANATARQVPWFHRCRDGKGRPCNREATVELVAPDDKPVPGGARMCLWHAKEVTKEYAAKLNERWHIRPLIRGDANA